MSTDNPYEAPQDSAIDSDQLQPVLSHDIYLAGSMPLGDVLHTQLLILRQNWHILAICMAIYFGFVLLLSGLEQTATGSRSLFLGSLLILPLLLPVTMASSYLRLRRSWRNQVGLFAETQSSIATEGISSRIAEKSFTLPWTAFERFLATDRVVILFLRESKSHLIVSRAKLANPADWGLLVEFLGDRLPRA